MPEQRPVLECQDCGRVLQELSAFEVEQIAHNPYNYIVFCRDCKDYKNESSWGYF